MTQERANKEDQPMKEIVIKISDVDYERLIASNGFSPVALKGFCEAVKNGIPLPKGHKRLIEDNFKVGPVFDKEGNRIGYQYVTQEDLNNAKTIIEADKETKDV